MLIASLSDILVWLGGAVVWFADNLGAPIVTGAAAGLAVPLALRWESASSQVRRHNREVGDLNDDFRRFMADLSRDVEAVFRQFSVERNMWSIRDEARERWAPEEKPNLAERLQHTADVSRWMNESQEAMHDAIWRYRDEALRKRRRFLELVEVEGRRHTRLRRKTNSYPALRLPKGARDALSSWHRRPNPYAESVADLQAPGDLSAEEPSLVVFETEEGLTWDAAKTMLDAPE
jgi:hypothetical protein